MVKAVSNKERRGFVRAKRVLSIQYRLAKSKRKNTDSKWHLSMTQDMSLGGLAFYTDMDLRADDVIELHVVMSGVLDIFNGYAKVLRVEKKKTGAYALIAVKFVDKISKPKTTRKAVSSNPTKTKRIK
jgi:c-di-GMP-binding flagellar brake protein YcgR